MRGVARTVPVKNISSNISPRYFSFVPGQAGATPPHNDLIRAPALHLLAVIEVLPAAMVGGHHLDALVVALTVEWSAPGQRFR